MELAYLLRHGAGRVVLLLRLAQRAPLRRQRRQPRDAPAGAVRPSLLPRGDSLPKLLRDAVEDVIVGLEDAGLQQPAVELEGDRPEHGPAVAEEEGNLLSDVVVAPRQPQPVLELPI